MKRQVLSLLLPALLVATSATAGTHRFSFAGLYAGAGIGQSLMNGSMAITGNASFAIPSQAFTSAAGSSVNSGLRKDSFMAIIYAGYGYSCRDPIYLSAEAFFKGAEADATLSATDTFSTTAVNTTTGSIIGNTTAKLRTWEYGLDFRPGLLLTCNTLLYGRVGIAFNKLSLNSTATVAVQNSGFATGPIILPFSQTNGKDVAGLRLGLGLEQELISNVTLRADYVYTQYNKAAFNTIATTTLPGPTGAPLATGTATYSASTKVFTHAMMLALSYYW